VVVQPNHVHASTHNNTLWLYNPTTFTPAHTTTPCGCKTQRITTKSYNYCRNLGKVAGELVWGKEISTKKAVRLAQELLAEIERFPNSAKAKQWSKESFSTMQEMLKTVMAFHVMAFTASWSASSGVECIFSFFKKFKGGELKRSLLYDAVVDLLLMVERRLSADAQIMMTHSWFIDERNAEVSDEQAKKSHEKKLSTSRLFGKELIKLQNATNCPWSEAIRLENKCMWLLREKNGESEVLHLVDLTGFMWDDSPENIPPRCHTCPCYRNGRIPCIGILTVLQNLTPLVGPASIFEWIGTGGLKKPEIFHNRWRIDKDPTRVLLKYSLAATAQASCQHSSNSEPPLLAPTVIPADVNKIFEDQMRRVSKLDDPRTKQNVLKNLTKLLSQNESYLAKYELDSMIHKVQKGISKWGQGQISTIDMKRGLVRPKKSRTSSFAEPQEVHQNSTAIRFQQTGSQQSSVAKAKAKKVATAPIPAGTSRRVPPEELWLCQVCNRSVKNVHQFIKQHCNGTTHAANVTSWREKGSKNWDLFRCRHCEFTVDESDAERNALLIRKHMAQHLNHKQNVGKKR
jgi:hypothetical protein